MNKLVSIIIPCYNESQCIPILYQELQKVTNFIETYDWEFLFINDGSTDSTLSELNELRLRDDRVCYIDLSRNFGKEAAMLAGFDHVKGDCVIIMDADLQHPPVIIPEMLSKWENGFDDVYASRLSRGRESRLRKKLTLFYYHILSKSSRIDVLPNVGDFRLLDRQCIEALKRLREKNRYTKGMYCYIGYKKTHVSFETQDRAAGKSHMSIRGLFNLALEGLLSYTTAPLRLASIVGLVTSIVALFYMAYVFLKSLIFGDPVQGFPTLMIVILFLGGIQLMALGIIGEYLGRVFSEAKNRPSYFIRSINGQKYYE